MRVCWRRGFGGGSGAGRVGGELAGVCVGGCGWVRKQSRVVWWLVSGRGWCSFTMVMFGVCCWGWVVVSVDGWLLTGWWWLVVAVADVSAAISHRGGSGVGVGRWWCVWGTCWFLRPDRGVPYFPVECIPVGLG